LELGSASLHVRVVSTEDRPISQSMRVRLLGGGGANPIAESYTDRSGVVSFSGLNSGTYRVLVTGQGYEDTDGGSVQLDGQRSSETVFVRVRLAAKDGPGSPTDPTVDVSRLKVPKKAIQEFEKGNGFLTQQQWVKAAEHYRKAIEIDPGFVDAYNNLAVAYARMDDREHEREALDHALKLNDHSVQALVNRARLALKEKDTSAEGLLVKATAVDPRNPEILMLLAKVQLSSGHFEAAVETAQRIHMLPHPQFALSHYLAARALEGENRLHDAKLELELFLQEESKGPRADAARKEIGLLESGLPLAVGNE
jgi:tetratricopeptide (TPR) repeat protein